MANLVFCLQLCPLDCDAAIDLTRLIADIEKASPTKSRPEWLISYRQDTPLSRVQTIQNLLVKSFSTVITARARYHASGWPAGSNALWRSAMSDANDLFRSGKFRSTGVLTFEPDCIPLRLDWIDRLDAEYGNRIRPIVGHIHQGDDPAAHINGNAMFPLELATKWPQLLETPMTYAWDYYHRDFILAHAQDTALITQWYRRKLLTEQEWPAIVKHGLRPALLHGVKDATGRRLARANLLTSQGRLIMPLKAHQT